VGDACAVCLDNLDWISWMTLVSFARGGMSSRKGKPS
jgi:hypothetical protein